MPFACRCLSITIDDIQFGEKSVKQVRLFRLKPMLQILIHVFLTFKQVKYKK